MSAPKDRMSVSSLFDEARQEFGSPDRGFLRTVWLLATAPGPTLRGIFEGTRPELTRPVRFFLFVFTLYSLIYISSGAMAILAAETNAHMVSATNEAMPARGLDHTVTAAEIAEANPLTYYLQYPLAGEILSIFLLWLSSWPVLARMGLTAAERISAVLYLYGMVDLAQLLMVPFLFSGHYKVAMGVLFVVFMAYLAWAVHGLAVPRRKFAFLRGIAWWLSVQLLSGIIFGAGLAMIGYEVGKRSAEAQRAAMPVTQDKPETR